MNYGNYVVAYDISSNKERDKVSKLLRNYGFRDQKSVFVCKLSKSAKNKLEYELNKLEIRSGVVKIYKIYENVKSKNFGKEVKSFDGGYCYFV